MSQQLIDIITKAILLIAYIAGTLIVLKQLKERNKTLKTQIDAQSSLINDMKTIMETLRAPIELHDKILDMHREESEYERKKALREFKEMADKSIELVIKEMLELLKLSESLVYNFSQNPKVEEYLNEMADDSKSKAKLIKTMKRSREIYLLFLDAITKNIPEERIADFLRTTMAEKPIKL